MPEKAEREREGPGAPAAQPRDDARAPARDTPIATVQALQRGAGN